MVTRLHAGDSLANGLNLRQSSQHVVPGDIKVVIVYNSATLVAQDHREITLHRISSDNPSA
jgi:hypothetical protein